MCLGGFFSKICVLHSGNCLMCDVHLTHALEIDKLYRNCNSELFDNIFICYFNENLYIKWSFPLELTFSKQLCSGVVHQCFFMCYQWGLTAKHVNLQVLGPGGAVRVNNNLN